MAPGHPIRIASGARPKDVDRTAATPCGHYGRLRLAWWVWIGYPSTGRGEKRQR
jgi:hypothetical protein